MKQRPLLLLCLMFLLSLFLLEYFGVPLLGGNPLPAEIRSWVSSQDSITISGTCDQIRETEQGVQVTLTKSYLQFHSRQYPIQTVQIWSRDWNVPYGASVVLSGILEEFPEAANPGEFDRRQYYAIRHCYYQMQNPKVGSITMAPGGVRGWLWKLRRYGSRMLETTSGDQAALLSAIVLGDRSDLTNHMSDQLRLAGFWHMCSVSGMHISILGLGVFRLMKKAGASHGAAGIPAMLLVLCYGMMTGSSISALRAVVMFLIAMMARILGRVYDPLSAMALCMILMLLESPGYLHDSGFLLSFSAIMSIGAIAPSLQSLLGGRNRMIRRLTGSLALFLGTLPIMLRVYGEVSIFGLVWNLVFVPLLPIVLGSGIGAILLGSIRLSFGVFAALPGRVILKGIEWLNQWPGKIPLSVWTPGAPSLPRVTVYILLLSLLLVAGERHVCFVRERRPEETERQRRKRVKIYDRGVRMGVLLVLTALIAALTIPLERDFTITCLSVGQGDSTVVRTPEGQVFLIDGGSTSSASVGTYQILPYLRQEGISVLDAVFVSHTDLDHINGILELFQKIQNGETTLRVKTLILPEWQERGKAWEQLCNLAEQSGTNVQTGKKGQEIHSGELFVRVLMPESSHPSRLVGDNTNEDSMILEVRYRDYLALFPGDAGEETEQRLLNNASLADVDFLKVGHHGSRYSTTEAFLAKVKPELAVISCGAENRYGHPAPETVERLDDANVHTEYTMEHGAITVTVTYRKGNRTVRVRRFRS